MNVGGAARSRQLSECFAIQGDIRSDSRQQLSHPLPSCPAGAHFVSGHEEGAGSSGAVDPLGGTGSIKVGGGSYVRQARYRPGVSPQQVSAKLDPVRAGGAHAGFRNANPLGYGAGQGSTFNKPPSQAQATGGGMGAGGGNFGRYFGGRH